VNWRLFTEGQASDWLDRQARRKIEGMEIHADASVARRFKSVCSSINRLRNQYAHAGMNTKPVQVSKGQVNGLLQACRELLGHARSDNGQG